MQADYLRGNWDDIEWNLGGGPGVGNAIGGVLFEWMDEWWKAGAPPTFDPSVHSTIGQFAGPFPDGCEPLRLISMTTSPLRTSVPHNT